MRLKFSGSEFIPREGVTTLGRTPDNDVAFPDDSNVSRYHAEIENRGAEFCLIDLGSSNGTTVNGANVNGETYLKPGDRILLGGSSELIFEQAENGEGQDDAVAANLPPVGDAARQVPSLVQSTPSPAAGSRTMLMVAGGAVVIAVLVVVVAGAVYYSTTTSGCEATARIIKPEPGDTIYDPTEIEVTTENTECVAKAVFTLNGKDFASSDREPYTATLDPNEHPDLADGLDHRLAIVLIESLLRLSRRHRSGNSAGVN